MPIHGEFIAGLVTSAAQAVLPEIAKGVDTVFGIAGDFISGLGGGGGTTPSTAVSQVSGSGIGAIVRGAQAQGTSVGPLIEAAGAVVTALPPIIAAVQQRRAPATGFGSPFGQQNIALPTRGAGMQTMTRRQFILATARANNPGATAKKIIRSARQCGIELAAATFGLNVLDVCFLIAQPPTRRARGISAADMRRTRSTLRKVATISHDLQHLKPTVRRRKAH